jgi:hypothetical protein
LDTIKQTYMISYKISIPTDLLYMSIKTITRLRFKKVK